MLSPGPANLAAYAMASRHGLARTGPFLLGIGTIYAATAGLAVVVGSQVIPAGTSFQKAWQVLGGFFIVYLGWRLVRATRASPPHGFTPGFRDGLILQLLNPKYPAVVLSVLANRPSDPPLLTALVIVIVGAVGLFGYALLGTTTRQRVPPEQGGRWVDRVFGVLLVVTGAWLVVAALR